MGLTAKQRAFVLEYPKDFNATQAAIRAGYSEKTAYSIANQLLKKPKIRAAIRDEFEKRIMSLDEALVRLSEQARGEKPTKTTRGIRAVTNQFDVLKALELIGKYHKMFHEKVEVDGEVKIRIEYTNADGETFEPSSDSTASHS